MEFRTFVGRRWSLPLAAVMGLTIGCSSLRERFSGMGEPKEPTLVEATADQKHDSPPNKPTAKMLSDFGDLYYTTGKHAEAEKLYRRALKLDKKFAPAYLGLARIANTQNKPTEALTLLKKGMKHEPESGDFWNEVAISHMKMDDSKAAIDSMRQAVKIAPNNRFFNRNLANMLAVHGDVEESYRIYAKLMAPADARYKVAGILFGKGDVDESVRQLQFALRANPSHQASARMLDRINSGEVQLASHSTMDADFERSQQPPSDGGGEINVIRAQHYDPGDPARGMYEDHFGPSIVNER